VKILFDDGMPQPLNLTMVLIEPAMGQENTRGFEK
jgi:hypothetical protein